MKFYSSLRARSRPVSSLPSLFIDGKARKEKLCPKVHSWVCLWSHWSPPYLCVPSLYDVSLVGYQMWILMANLEKNESKGKRISSQSLTFKPTPIRSSNKKKLKKICWKHIHSARLFAWVERRDKWFDCVLLTVTG